MIDSITKNSGFLTQLAVFAGGGAGLFVLMLVVRAVKIAHNKDADEGHAMAKQTPGIVF
jgi:hypothetical protein